MDILLISDTAWTCVSVDDSLEAEDDVRLTECGEGFLQMLLAITDRYKILPQPGHKLQFLDLQLELLDEFRIRLLQLAGQSKFHELFANRSSPNISPFLNTLTAVINVLDDWADLPVKFAVSDVCSGLLTVEIFVLWCLVFCSVA